MTKEEQDNIIKCLESVGELAHNCTDDNRGVARLLLVVLNALNLLFEKEGLEPVKELFREK